MIQHEELQQISKHKVKESKQANRARSDEAEIIDYRNERRMDLKSKANR